VLLAQGHLLVDRDLLHARADTHTAALHFTLADADLLLDDRQNHVLSLIQVGVDVSTGCGAGCGSLEALALVILTEPADVDHVVPIEDCRRRLSILIRNTLHDDHGVALLDSLRIQIGILLRNACLGQSIVEFRFPFRGKRCVVAQSGCIQIVHRCLCIVHALE